MVTVIVIGTGYEFQVPEHMAAEFAKMYPDKAADIASEYPDQAAVIAETLNDREYIPSVVGAVPSATGEIIKRCPDACRTQIFLALLESEHITDGGDIVVALEGVTLRDSEIEDFIASTPEDYGVDVASELFGRKPTCWPTVIIHLSLDNAKEFVGRHRSEMGCAKLELDDSNAVVYAMVYPDEAGDVAKRFPELIDDILDVTPPTSAYLLVAAVPDSFERVVTKSEEHLLDVVNTLFNSRDDAQAIGVVEALCNRGLSEEEIAISVNASPADKILAVADWLFGILPHSWPTVITHLSVDNAKEFVGRHRSELDCAELTLDKTNADIYALVYPDKAGDVARQFPELIKDILDAALAEQLPTVVEQIFDVFADLWPTLIMRLSQSDALTFLRAHAADIARGSILVTPPRFGPED